MKKYNPQTIEKKWQEYWATNNTFAATENSDKEKRYVLVEFPYPSGDGLHMGHLRSYTAADVLARCYRMQGKEVMYPIGWDAFGLPAENYAIKHGVQPAITTAKNIENIKKQCQRLGYSFDWNREVNTTDPEYYKWTQWLFLKFFEAGLAYEATGLINWCPKDKTGLANEEVVNGHCERCGTLVEKKELRQWYLKITEYADKLLQGLETLPEWPEAVKLQQANWIGKSEGAEIDFAIQGTDQSIKVFTTRPDTIFGATYLVLAPEHELLSVLLEEEDKKLENFAEVAGYVQQAKSKTEIDRSAEGKEKTGVELKGVKAINPATNEQIPIFVADYVLGGYGTGAIMAVPAHDSRDFEFAKKYNIPIVQVVAPKVIDTVNPPVEGEEYTARKLVHVIVKHPTEEKFISLKWKEHKWNTFVTGGVEDGEDLIEAAKREALEETGYKNMTFVAQMPYIVRAEFFAKHKNVNRRADAYVVILKLDDLDQDQVVKEEQDLFEPEWWDMKDMKHLSPVSELEYILNWLENGDGPYTGEGVLINSGEFTGLNSTEALEKMAAKYGIPKTTYKLRDWVFSRQRYWGEPIPIVHCETDGVVAVPYDQLPVVLPEVKQYEPTGTGESPLAAIDDWVNTACPKCGGEAKREANTMPQWAGSSWYYLRYADARNNNEFAAPDKLKYWLPVDTYFGGMEHTTLHLLYSRFWNIFLHDQGLVPVSEPYTKRVPHGMVLAADGSKMSKSKGNVINPDEIVKKYGADTARMYELFLGPHEASVSWSDQGITGVARFLDRVWYWVNNITPSESNSEIADREINILIKKITEDIAACGYNTAISNFMKFHNEVKDEAITKQSMVDFIRLLYPFAPHISEEIFELLGGEGSVQHQPWPQFDEGKIATATVKIVVQVNGKVRDTLEVAVGGSQEEVLARAIQSEKVSTAMAGKQSTRVIFVKDKLINIVL
ncbi:leucine--tRNA ligase [bacterium]|nr:MAG: leucine--tRNA ligase [bacterium]